MAEHRKGFRIFVVDDEQTISWTLTTILRRDGFGASAFTKPLEALQAARSEPPDLLISDVVMPLLSGIDLAIEFSKCCPNCKVLLFSGQFATADLLEDARRNGYTFQMIAKPVHPKVLLQRVHDLSQGVASNSEESERALIRFADNTRSSVEEVNASFATSEARKGPVRRNARRARAKLA